MNVVAGRIILATVMGLGLSSASLAREAAHTAHGTKTHARGARTAGFTEPAFSSGLRAGGRDQPYTWPVSDRYHPVSQPFYGRPY